MKATIYIIVLGIIDHLRIALTLLERVVSEIKSADVIAIQTPLRQALLASENIVRGKTTVELNEKQWKQLEMPLFGRM